MNTDFRGRVANTPLNLKHGLLPLFEAIVNSIDSIAQRAVPMAVSSSQCIATRMTLPKISMETSSLILWISVYKITA